jgi:hypothetical protein
VICTPLLPERTHEAPKHPSSAHGNETHIPENKNTVNLKNCIFSNVEFEFLTEVVKKTTFF